jgi:hypothetical protein
LVVMAGILTERGGRVEESTVARGGGGEVQIFAPQERMTFRTDRRLFGK